MKKNKMGMLPPDLPKATEEKPVGIGHTGARKGYSSSKDTMRLIITIEESIVDEVDLLLANMPVKQSRSFWVIEAIQEKLNRANQKIRAKEKAKAQAFVNQGSHR